ncbi:MAG: nitrogenase component 1 [Erysipelotrichales bacterium]
MNDYLKSITPDSFSGEIFAYEGIDNVITLVNGPSGCKFYHSATADYQTIKQSEFDPLNFPEKWYFGQPRVPCTYLDTKDYVYGSQDKLEEAISYLSENVTHDLLCLVNSHGASLIGDDLEKIVVSVSNRDFVIIESPGYSLDISDGFDYAFVQLFKQLGIKKRGVKKKTVNILGLSIYHKHHLGDIEELERLFNLCGIEVNTFLGAKCSLEEIKNITTAQLNIVLHPEYGIKSAEYLKDELDMPYYVCEGLPIGFKSTAKLFSEVSDILECDIEEFIIDSEKARANVYPYISRVNSLTGLPKSVPYSIEGSYSEVYSYVSFLSGYLGMIIERINILNEDNKYSKKLLDELLFLYNRSDAYNINIFDNNSDLFFGNGNSIAKMKLLNKDFSGIEICLPSLGYIDIVKKTHLGNTGAKYLIEQVLNGLMF